MGTRRSKHNKGRKPLYKEHRATDIVAKPWWECGEGSQQATASPQPHHRRANPAPIHVDLERDVAVYLERRRAAQEAERAKEVRTQETFEALASIPSSGYFDAIGRRVSDGDILWQFAKEKRLFGIQIVAGRAWQEDLRQAALQPPRSFDWSERPFRPRYQTRGGVTDRQWDAMARRREFVRSYGLATASFLDACLDGDKNRQALMRQFQCDADSLHAALDAALMHLCEHLGMALRDN